ncbi:glycerophosphodiester phosphodiesterase [Adhaeretor mobilis]|uniref:glycerophosphodiester phosphodiesterase n=1 Tax=Adhaeretor mobilis TaxID=1930276 RepID=UPI001C54E1CB|nr:glycerophosphodiester phosphodiesterase [Adhaeretor mobilis]
MINRVFITAVLWCLANGVLPEAYGQTIIAHRGASSDAPENTISAFQLAWEQGADGIEGDFHLTADGQIVCFHDASTKRLCGVDTKIAESTLAELQKLDVGRWKGRRFAGERMPTLSDVLSTVPQGKLFYIEIKCGPEIVPHLVNVLAKSDVNYQDLRIISFKRDVIKAAKQALPQVQAYWLVEFKFDKKLDHWYPTHERVIAIAVEHDADGIDLKANKPAYDEAFILRCQQAGLSLHAWTVDQPEAAIRLAESGYESITTNVPKLLRHATQEQLMPSAKQLESSLENAPLKPSPTLEPAAK